MGDDQNGADPRRDLFFGDFTPYSRAARLVPSVSPLARQRRAPVVRSLIRAGNAGTRVVTCVPKGAPRPAATPGVRDKPRHRLPR